MSSSRQLAAIMFTDIVGYTTMMGQDSEKALQLVRISKEIQKPLVERYNGQWLKEMGDGVLAKFNTALDAVNCALAIQKTSNSDFDGQFRIGIHLGDITMESNEVYGDGVNIASRLQSIADPGGIYISDNVEKSVRGQSGFQAQYLGEIELKNVDYGVRTYALQGEALPIPQIGGNDKLTGHFWVEVKRRGLLRAIASFLLVSAILLLLVNQLSAWGVALPPGFLNLVLIFLAVMLPVAIYMAWNFERSPGGFVRTTSKDSWQNPLDSSRRKPLTSNLVMTILGLGVAAMVVYNMVGSKGSTNPSRPIEKSIAVLPLDLIGGEPEGAYFAAGVREEILNHLSLLEGLNVKSGSVVDRMEAQLATTQELVSELGLTHYLEGSAQKVGDRIRVTVQLIDAATNDHVWFENYDRNYENLLDTQSEIARKIAEKLEIVITPEVSREIEKQPTENPMAWDNYLKAQYYLEKFFSRRELEDLKNAVVFLKGSLRQDPDFALGYAYLALAYHQTPGDPSLTIDFINPDSSIILANRAIELDPNLSTPYLVKAYHFWNNPDSAYQNYLLAINKGQDQAMPYWAIGNFYHYNTGVFDLVLALSNYFTALDNQPETWQLAGVLAEIGQVYMDAGDYIKSAAYLDKAISYDPEDIKILGKRAQLCHVTGKYQQLLGIAQEVMRISPLNEGLYQLARYHLLVGEYEQAADYYAQYFLHMSKTSLILHENHMYAYALLKAGRKTEAQERFKLLRDILNEYGKFNPQDYEYAKVYAATGKPDSAYYYLEKAVDGPIRWGMPDIMLRDPLLERIKDEPQFLALVEKARSKVAVNRMKIEALEASGEIPRGINELEIL